jgi:hypothetical protein
LGLLALAPILFVFVLLVFFPPDGNERAKWAQFIGRFHPLAVHFPIALFLLVPILELAGLNSRLSYLRLSAGFVLGLATVGTIVAAMLGWCLARSGGYRANIDTTHVGWNIAGGSLLAVLDATCERELAGLGASLPDRACDWRCSGGLDWIPRRAIVSGRRSSDRVHAHEVAALARNL